MKKVYYYLFIFFVASILGWIGELIFRSLILGSFAIPGTLNFIWCPIYGVAAIIIYSIVKRNDKLWLNIIKIGTVCILDEYLAAYISEEIFNNKLWDYSTFLFNFQGRICATMTVLFIIIGIITVYFLFPILKKIYEKNYKRIKIIDYVMVILFIIDIIIKFIY